MDRCAVLMLCMLQNSNRNVDQNIWISVLSSLFCFSWPRTFISEGAFWFLYELRDMCLVKFSYTILSKNWVHGISGSSTTALLKRLSSSSAHTTAFHCILKIHINSMCLTNQNSIIMMHVVGTVQLTMFPCVFRVSAALTSLIRWILRIRWPFMKLWNSRQSPSLKLASR